MTMRRFTIQSRPYITKYFSCRSLHREVSDHVKNQISSIQDSNDQSQISSIQDSNENNSKEDNGQHQITLRHQICTRVNHNLVLAPDVEQAIEGGKYPPKHHPGHIKAEKTIPERLHNSIQILADKYPKDVLLKSSQKLYAQVWSKRLAPTDEQIISKAEQLKKKLENRMKKILESNPDKNPEIIEHKMQDKLLKTLQARTYNWTKTSFEGMACVAYTTSRGSHDYVATHRVLKEISQRDPEFQPSTMLDFGSGIGSAVWAANEVWPSCIDEHICVDESSNMNIVARLLMQDGNEEKETCFKNVYFRQHLPRNYKNQYDVVVSAFTLLEFEHDEERRDILLSLWRKTKKYMVIIENGTNFGFHVINQARDLFMERQRDSSQIGHIFAPCPHDGACPRVRNMDGTPCNFGIKFHQFYPNQHQDTPTKGNYVSSRMSYIILKKGDRDSTDVQWPRIVRNVKPLPRQASLVTCSPSGCLETSVITKRRHGLSLYQCAKNSSWGDLLPVHSPPEPTIKNRKQRLSEKNICANSK